MAAAVQPNYLWDSQKTYKYITNLLYKLPPQSVALEKSDLSAVEDEKLLLLASLFLAAFVTLSNLERSAASSSEASPSSLGSSVVAESGTGSTTVTAFTSVKSSSPSLPAKIGNGTLSGTVTV